MFTLLRKRSMVLNTFVLCLLLVQCAAYLREPLIVDPDPEPVPESDDKCPSATAVAKYKLCQDFRDIRDLIPANTFVYIISSHYQNDASFRKAMSFMKTPQFASISQQIAESEGYQNMLQRFADAGVNTGTIANISNIFNCLLLSEPDYSTGVEELTEIKMQNVIVPRSLQSLSTEMVKAIPRADFNALIRDKLAQQKEFAKFYRIVRSESFAQQLNSAFKSYQLAYPLKVLKRNNIDLCQLAKLARKLLVKGPRVRFG